MSPSLSSAPLATRDAFHDSEVRPPEGPLLRDALDELLEAAMEATGANMGGIDLCCGFGLHGVYRGFAPHKPPRLLEELQLHRPAVLGCGQRIIVYDLVTLDFLPESNEALRAAGVRTMQLTPLPPIEHMDGPAGVLATYHLESWALGERELRLLDVLARHASKAIYRVWLETSLRQSERRRETLMELLPAAVYTCEASSGVIQYFNQRAAELWGPALAIGETEERFCGCHRFYRLDGTLVAHEETPMALVRAGAPAVRDQEVIIERPDGSRIVAAVNIASVRDADGRPVCAVNVFEDITERKRAEEALRRSEAEYRRLADALKEEGRRKDEFLATLAHELRNPLAPIRAGLTVLKSSADSDARSHVQEILERQVNHIVRLVDDLLELSRVTRGKIELRKERIDLRRIVEDAIEIGRPFIEERDHAFSVELPAEALMLDADPVRIAQVIANLLHNAATYTKPGGEIRVRVWHEPPEAAVAVSDTGIGIPEHLRPHLFDMFAQPAPSILDGCQHGGLGIGLALARRLVRMHDGNIEANSDGPGRGSEFVVRLPAVAAGREVAAPPEDTRVLSQESHHRILIVDDNHDAAQTIGMLLEMMGHSVDIAYDGSAALEKAANAQFDTVLLDIGLPDLSGYEVARRLRQDQRLSRTLIIAMTGYGRDQDKQRSREAGFDEHLVKPVKLEALQALLN